ncbi:MAG: pentapeptide repeat-containing protein, partial [Bifidobacteriaceae bacterium]|nr:pentapeptide repeat-containing protein [Bifidobacteriaceae bacterium]
MALLSKNLNTLIREAGATDEVVVWFVGAAVFFFGGVAMVLRRRTNNRWHPRGQDLTPAAKIIAGGCFTVCAALVSVGGLLLVNSGQGAGTGELEELESDFNVASAQLGDADPHSRTIGVRALADAADRWDEVADSSDRLKRNSCIEILVDYLKVPVDLDDDGNPDAAEAAIRKAIAEELHEHLKPDVEHSWSDFPFDFTGAQFVEADLSGARFRAGEAVHFDQARFLGEAIFTGSRFQAQATFVDTQFKHSADFRDVVFDGEVDFSRAVVSGDLRLSGAH